MEISTVFRAALAHRRIELLALSLLLVGPVVSSIAAQMATNDQINCTDPSFSVTAACRGTSDPASGGISGAQPQRDAPRNAENQQVYQDTAGSDARSRVLASSREEFFPSDPITDFQRLARASTGETLPIFGRNLFERSPSTFAPADQIPVTSNYVVGPGDELLVRLWGPDTLNSQLTVDTTGAIYIPKVGTIHVAGLRFDELQKQISSEVSRVFRNYNISINLGHLRSIQVYVVGEARRPGAYTISSLSTVLNALFVSGGPNVQGSLRRIQIRRDGQPTVEFDLYDLVLHGDKSKDVRLEQGDTLFIPAAGPQVALAGSVRHPAIYELRGETSLHDLMELAGGFTPTAASTQISIQRIDTNQRRQSLNVGMDVEGRDTRLHDGDVLFVNHISQGYEQSVSIRGNLANPGRFAWHSGMRLSEIIPDRMSLLTNGYWQDRNRLGIPEPLFEPTGQNERFGHSIKQNETTGRGQAEQGNAVQDTRDPLSNQASRTQAGAAALQSTQLPSSSSSDSPQQFSLGAPGVSTLPSSTSVGMAGDLTGSIQNGMQSDQRGMRTNTRREIQIPAPEIDWSYAVIERLDPNTLKSLLLPFNLGALVQDHNPTQDLELQPGDVVTILSQADIPVPLDEQTKFIRLEGEFTSAGVYSVHPGETLRDVVRRAGGLSSKAYLYGSSFLRESARAFQQQRLNEYISTLSTDMERSAAVRAASSTSGVLDPNGLAEERSLIAQLRQMRATGRVVLEFQPDSLGPGVVPEIALENGDVFRVPSRPNTVSVIGAVYGQNIFLFNSDRRVEDYIALAGKPNRIADRKHAFIIRADGSIYSRERAQGIWENKFNTARINPGDSIVIPEKLVKPTALRQFLDYSQIISSFGFAAAAISVIR